jgi:hypothetical protein
MFNFDTSVERIKCGTNPRKIGSIVNAWEKLRFCFCIMFEDSANVFVNDSKLPS